jgi:hypothetical protein
MVCHEEVLEAVRAVVRIKGINEFSPEEVSSYLINRKTIYAKSSIKTHIVSRCCVNAPENHAVRYQYFKRIGHGLYKLIK